jgi:plasmid maintenance system antidote protein VapI
MSISRIIVETSTMATTRKRTRRPSLPGEILVVFSLAPPGSVIKFAAACGVVRKRVSATSMAAEMAARPAAALGSTPEC